MKNTFSKEFSLEVLGAVATNSFVNGGTFALQEIKHTVLMVKGQYADNKNVTKAYIINCIHALAFHKLIDYKWMSEIGNYADLWIEPTARGVEQLKKYDPQIMKVLQNAWNANHSDKEEEQTYIINGIEVRPLEVLMSNAGFYIGRLTVEGEPFCRETPYFKTRKQAQEMLDGLMKL